MTILGSNLLYILNETFNEELKKYVKHLEENVIYFNDHYSSDLGSYWIGGTVRHIVCTISQYLNFLQNLIAQKFTLQFN